MKRIILLGDIRKINRFLFSLKEYKFKNVSNKFNFGEEDVLISPYHLRTDLDQANAVVFIPSDNLDFYKENKKYTNLLTRVPDEAILVEYDNNKIDNEPKDFVEDLLVDTPESDDDTQAGFSFFSHARHSTKKTEIPVEIEETTNSAYKR